MDEPPIVQVDAPTSEAEGEAIEAAAEEATAQVEDTNDAMVEIERLRQEGETERCAIEAEARVQTEEAYSEARIAEAEAIAETNGADDEWRQSIEASLASLSEALANLTAGVPSTPQPSTPAEPVPPMSNPESEEADPQAIAQVPEEPPKKVKRLRWI